MKRKIKGILLFLILFITISILTGCKIEFPENATSSFDVNENSQFSSIENITSSSLDDNSIDEKSTQIIDKTSIQETSLPEKENKLYCFLEIECKTILNNLDKLDKSKSSIIPKDGIIFSKRQIEFKKGESVFDILLRETKNNKIHLEYTPSIGLSTNYIEGIANIYEFDCGSNSGWMFSVNNQFVQTGANKHIINPNDDIKFSYTCQSGKDLS
ncbi:MAG: DUF4430 domain-containing protein [Oscillospiraceae bacterium]